MKIFKYTSIAIIALSLCTACSVYNKISDTITSPFQGKSSQAKPEPAQAQQAQSKPQNQPLTIHEEKNEIILTEAEPEADAQQLYGEWTVKRVRGKRHSSIARAFINLDFNTLKFYGNTGCNIINGTFNCTAHSIAFANIITTMMECGIAEQPLLKALEETASYSVGKVNGVDHLTLKDAHGRELLLLKRQNLDFLNGAWTVKHLPDVDVTDNCVNLVIDIDMLAIHGNSGCNIINGDITIDTEKDWAIQFDNLISTRKACPDMAVETALLVALEDAVAVKKISNEEMNLVDKRDSTVVVLSRLQLQR